MKNLNNTTKIGMIALIFGIFSSTILLANGTSNEELKKEKSKDEVSVAYLEKTALVDEELLELEADLTDEGILSCSKDMIVKILNEADEVIYEGTYNGISAADQTLRKYMSKADLLVNVGNVAYYMVF